MKDFTESPQLRRIKAVAKKEVFHILRDLRSLLIVILMPIVMLILYGYALNFDIKEIRLTVVDHDQSSLSRAFVEKFAASGYFRLTNPPLNSLSEAEELILSGKTTLVLVIPHRFMSDLRRNRHVSIQAIADGSDPNTTGVALGYTSTLLSLFSGQLALERLQKSGIPVKQTAGIRYEPRIWFNQEMRSAFFIVPGLISIMMMLTAALLTSLTLIREKENGTFEQIIASPIQPIELMIGKLLPYILIGFIDVVIITFFGGVIFNVPFKGNYLLLAFFSLFFIFCALGIGLLFSSFAQSQTVAVIGTVFATVLPSIMLSGFVFPIDSLPWFIRPFSYLIPAKYFLAVLRTLFLKEGAGFSSMALDGLALLFFGFAFLFLASKRMRKSLE